MSPCIVLCRTAPEPAQCAIQAAGPVELLQQSHRSSKQAVQATWVSILLQLRDSPAVTFGTPEELARYSAFVKTCIEQAASLAASDKSWGESGLVLECLRGRLSRAVELVKAGKTSSGRSLAVELIGYAQLAQVTEQLRGGVNALSSLGKASGEEPVSSSTSSSSSSSSMASSSAQFKVPALPLKRQRSPDAGEQQQQSVLQSAAAEPQLQQHRRHAAPKRRATPQVWAGGPICITPTAPPDSAMHGETCCDETLLAYWCPISGKRLKCDPQQDPSAADSHDSTAGLQESQEHMQPQPQHVQEQPVPMSGAGQHRDASMAACASSISTKSSSQMRQGSAAPSSPAVATLSPVSRSAISSARSDAIEALKRSMHQDPASKPAADMLLFNKATQLPIVNWTGPIKHKANGRVVELCSLTLQVPEAFLEEFPGALYAAEIRHRKAVSLGRHVVCRATLQPLSEHQLSGLAAMARAQLVALCMLQTAELHLVPYFDNKNHVRCVGFLKIKAT